MSDNNNNAYLHHLYSEQYAEDLERAGRAVFTADVAAMFAGLAAFNSAEAGRQSPKRHAGRIGGAKTFKRQRLDIVDHFNRMDPRLFRRKYRMIKTSFYTLLDILDPYLPSTGEDRAKPGSVPNGPITKSSRLSMALRYCAGGDPADIADHHGVKTDEVLKSVWAVVDAIHKAPQLNIVFPQSPEEQDNVAQGFKAKSDLDIDVCAGAIDGILIWIHKPSKNDAKAIQFGPAKFFCGRKKKFGLNMQAICDSQRRFLDVEIRFPGSTSDFFAFEQSKIKSMIEEEGFLRPGFCLFGDNAYVNSPYMCVPYRNVAAGTKMDSFNFFQSQVHINVECAFGILVHRFGILRKPIPMGIDIQKTTSLVLAICKLHNFCIEQNDCDLDSAYRGDVSNIMREGGMYRPKIDDDGEAVWTYDLDEDRVNELLDGGEHQDDHAREERRRYRQSRHLPRSRIFTVVSRGGYNRPSRSRRHR